MALILVDCVLLENRVGPISFDLPNNGLVMICGPNGSGKSSLLKLMAGLVAPNSGDIKFNDLSLQSVPISQRTSLISWVPQSHEVAWPISVSALLDLTPLRTRSTDELVSLFDLTMPLEQPCDELSGGQLAQVVTARAFASKTETVLLDEPTAALDPRNAHRLLATLKELSQKQLIVVSCHDLNLVARYADTTILLHKGQLAHLGKAKDVLTRETLKEVYDHDFNIIDGDALWIQS